MGGLAAHRHQHPYGALSARDSLSLRVLVPNWMSVPLSSLRFLGGQEERSSKKRKEEVEEDEYGEIIVFSQPTATKPKDKQANNGRSKV